MLHPSFGLDRTVQSNPSPLRALIKRPAPDNSSNNAGGTGTSAGVGPTRSGAVAAAGPESKLLTMSAVTSLNPAVRPTTNKMSGSNFCASYALKPLGELLLQRAGA
jgi:hypothetical protein